MKLQRTLRRPFLDVYFSVTAFFAEEEFYLIVLPLLFWNVDYSLALHMNYIVCGGLFVGNTIKDVFELPRPSSPPVWRPKHQEAIDSTMMKDFGFPSTHTMNAVSNSFFAFFYLVSRGIVTTSVSYAWCTAATIVWIVSLTLGRLYLGAHSVVDIVGGFWLGIVVFASYAYFEPTFTEYVATTNFLSVKCLVVTIVALLLCPQPRPPTPTFMQNALIAGLITGAAMGFRLRSDAGIENANSADPLIESAPEWQRERPLALAALRTVGGYVFVLTVRFILKPTLRAILTAVGMYKKPSLVLKQKKDDGDGEGKKKKKTIKAPRKSRVVLLLTRGVDILAGAIIKTLTYFAMAFSITYVVPLIFFHLGIASTS